MCRAVGYKNGVGDITRRFLNHSAAWIKSLTFHRFEQRSSKEVGIRLKRIATALCVPNGDHRLFLPAHPIAP